MVDLESNPPALSARHIQPLILPARADRTAPDRVLLCAARGVPDLTFGSDSGRKNVAYTRVLLTELFKAQTVQKLKDMEQKGGRTGIVGPKY